ncbi:hypothetical protein [Candidatus Laterigemmans baculatus]|uniref:hypothetical protein n=1 Tax=Candidatus Laterigemmans baculatus TaxID=2770505 RepID=UPI001F2BCE5F|nr:hypothetical protein [Candidatus Laterigemmans baculatus]
MNRLTSFLLGMVTGAVLLTGAMNYHLVHSDEGILMIPKLTKGLDDPYVDIRSFTLADWQEHRALAAALVQAQKSELLADGSLVNFRRSIDGVIEGLLGPRG